MLSKVTHSLSNPFTAAVSYDHGELNEYVDVKNLLRGNAMRKGSRRKAQSLIVMPNLAARLIAAKACPDLF